MAAAGAEGKASLLELVRYADARDRCLMALGALGSFGDGMMQPLSMLVLADIVNSYGGAGTAGSVFSSAAVDKVKKEKKNSATFPARTASCHGTPKPDLARACSSRSGCCTSRSRWAPARS